MTTSSIDTTKSKEGNRLALIIGVNEAPKSSLAPLHHAAADAESMAIVLEQYGKFTLLAPPLVGEEANSNAIKKAVLNLMRDRKEEDVLLLYFSGHGLYLPVEREDQPGVDLVYLVTSDFCEQEAEEDPTLHLSMRWLRDNLVIKTRAGQVLLILDCCYAGAIGQTGPDPQYRDLLQQIASYFRAASTVREAKPGGLRLALTATSALLPSMEGDEHGVMTEPLLRALRGEVLDVLGNEGQITVTSLYGYLHETMPIEQKPSFSGDAAAKNYILTWHPERLAELRKQRGHSLVNERPNSYIPFPHSTLFQPRPGEFEYLERLLFDQKTGHKPTRLGLVGVLGLGGVGKTQLAIELAHRYKDHFPAGIFWMPATGTTALDWQKPLAELAEKTEYLPANDDPSDRENEARRARHLCRYLASHRDALLILDNVEDPSLVTTALPALAGEEVACALLYTSRNTVAPPGVIPHVIEQLPEEGALHLLLETTRPLLLSEGVTGSQSAEAKAAREICRTVGYLPLALMHLRGLLARDQQMSLEQLNEVLKQRGVLDLEKKTQLGDVAPLFTTFWLSWEKVRDEGAQRLFKLAAYFPEATPIPLWLLGLAAGLGEDWHYPNPLWEPRVGLQELSLMETLSGGQVRLHPLVRTFGRRLVTEELEQRRPLLEEAEGRLRAEFTNLRSLENRALRVGYWGCLEQVRAAIAYMELIESNQAEHLQRIEQWLIRESHLLADQQWWPSTLPALFYQQLANRSMEDGHPLNTEQVPLHWLKLNKPIGEGRSLLKIFGDYTSPVSSVAFSPDGKLILVDAHQVWETSTGRLLISLEGPIGSVVAFSPDGKLILTGSSDGAIGVWETNNWRLLSTSQGPKGSVVAFSPDGKLALTNTYGSTVPLWETSTGRPLVTLQGHAPTLTIRSMMFSPDGKLVLTGSSDGTARLWESNTGKLLSTLKHATPVTSVAFSPDGKLVLTSSFKTAWLWETSTGKLLSTLEDPTNSVNSVAFSPDGKLILAITSLRLHNGTVRLWETSTGKLLTTLEDPTNSVNSVAFSPDGKLVLTGSSDGSARLWETSTGKLLAILQGHTDSVNSVAFSPDGKLVLTGSSDGTARLWETNTDKLPISSQDSITDDEDTARLWETSTGLPLATSRYLKDIITEVVSSPDGKLVLTDLDWGTSQVWETSSGRLLSTLQGRIYNRKGVRGPGLTSVAFSSDGKLVLINDNSSPVQVWETSSGRLLATLQRDYTSVKSPAFMARVFSPDGKLELTGLKNENPYHLTPADLLETSSGRLIATLPGLTSTTSVAFSPDGKLVLTNDHSTTKVWETSSGRLIATLQGGESVMKAAFSPDGQLVLTADQLWETSNGKLLATLQRDYTSIPPSTRGTPRMSSRSVFSPDGKLMLTRLDDDTTIYMWETSSGRLLATLQGHTLAIMSVGFSPDGMLAITGDARGCILLWSTRESQQGRLLGMYIATDVVEDVHWQDATHVVLADRGGTLGHPLFHRLSLEGEW